MGVGRGGEREPDGKTASGMEKESASVSRPFMEEVRGPASARESERARERESERARERESERARGAYALNPNSERIT